MNAEAFYEDFKAALRFLGVQWGEMASVAVYIDGDKLVLSQGRTTAAITLEKAGD